MPRPGVGNPGNKGGRPYSKENREKAAKVKGMTLDYLLRALKGKDEELKKQIVLKIATVCFPQEITGADGGSLFPVNYEDAQKIRIAKRIIRRKPDTGTSVEELSN